MNSAAMEVSHNIRKSLYYKVLEKQIHIHSFIKIMDCVANEMDIPVRQELLHQILQHYQGLGAKIYDGPMLYLRS